jgi:hypothetical protein
MAPAIVPSINQRQRRGTATGPEPCLNREVKPQKLLVGACDDTRKSLAVEAPEGMLELERSIVNWS